MSMILRLLLALIFPGVLLVLPYWLRPAAPAGISDRSGRDTLVILSAHNKTMRDEYDHAFRAWYIARIGRDIHIDWRTPGGTSDIMRYIADSYTAEFRQYWHDRFPNRPWTRETAKAFSDPRLDSVSAVFSADADQRLARKTFLESEIGIGVDMLAGGGAFDLTQNAAKGFAVDGKVKERHPEYFSDTAIPAEFSGEKLYDPEGRYYGVVLSTFGICANRDRLNELKISTPPRRWEELAEGRFFRQLALADPSKSGSANKCFEIMVQQQMAQAGNPQEGWTNGINLLKRIFANCRHLTDSASEVVRYVRIGEAAAGTGIDSYAFAEIGWVKSTDPANPDRFLYIAPEGGTAVSPDPVQILRGAPHRKQAEMFLDFLLSIEGQKLHCFKVGTPGGPVKFAMNRPPIRKELYAPQYRELRFEADYDPYRSGADFVYRPQWTGKYYSLLRILLKSIVLDPHPELVQAWEAILRAGGPEKVPQAMAYFNALPFDYNNAADAAAALRKDPVSAAVLLRNWSETARNNYCVAARLAQEGK